MEAGIKNLFVYLSCFTGVFGITLQPSPIANCQRYNSLILTCSIKENWVYVGFDLQNQVGSENIAAFTDTGSSCKDNAAPTPGLYQTSCDYNSKTFYLTITNVTDTYNGKFIECRFLPGTSKTSTTINVQYAPTSSPTITQMRNGPVHEGDKVTLTCKVSIGNPSATIVWQCSGFDVITSTVTPPTDELVSIITRTVTKDDNGRECVCIGKHLLWDDDQEIRHTLNVYFKPTSIPSIKQTPTGPVNASDRIVLTCEIQGGNPLAVIAWVCDGSSSVTTTGSQKPDTSLSSVQMTVSTGSNGIVCKCKGSHPLWKEDKITNVMLDVRYAPASFPIITQSPNGPVIESNRVTLTCKVSGGRPLAIIVWQCSGFTAVIATYTPSTDLVVSSIERVVTKDDNGRKCVCTGKHLLWDKDKDTRHTLNVYYQPTVHPIIIQTPPGTVNDSDRIILSCEIQGGSPLAAITWECGGSSPVPPTGSPKPDTSVSIVQLTVNKDHNREVCTCKGSHPAWKENKTANVTLDVTYAPISSPTITQMPSGAVIEGDTVSLSCTIYIGNPLATIVWQCTGFTAFIPNTVPSTEKSVSIITRNVTKDDNGKECVCTGKHLLWDDEKVERHTLNVYFGPKSIDLSPLGFLYIVTETKSVNTIMCAATCRPDCNYTWTGPHDFRKHHSYIRFDSIYRNQTGLYSCQAQNGFGSISSNHVNIIVNYAPTIRRLQVLKSNTVDEHQSVTFQCDVDSYPAPDITWIFYKTNTPLKNDVNVFKSNYTVSKADCLQTGSYRCQASNVIDAMVVNAFSETNLFVLCSVRTDQRYLETPEDISIVENDDLNITVYLLAYPIPLISWTMRNSETGIISTVTYNNSFNIFEHMSTVYISKMSKRDYGVYTVNAFNNIGLQYIRSFIVIPQGPPNQPTDVLVACEITSMLISWQPGFNGGIEQTFRVAWLNLKTQHTGFSSVITDLNQGHSKQYIVKSLDPATMYIIYVEASNEHGIVRSRQNANCTTGANSNHSHLNGSLAISIGAGIGSSVLILIVAALVVFVLKRRTNYKEENSKLYQKAHPNTSQQKTNDDQHNYSELQTIRMDSNPEFMQPSSSSTYEEIGSINNGHNYGVKRQ